MAIINGTIGNDLIDLTFTVAPTNAADTINGLEGNDTIFGFGGDDTIDGGLGADTMNGGLGNDIFIVDNAADVVIEAGGEGNDEIRSSVSYTLSSFVENLVLTGTGKINGTGNGLNNIITGNATNNRINGGLGNDTMAGGKGNDTYTVDSSTDVVTEAASQGTDKIESSVSIALLAANVERLTLTGTANLNGTGNALGNLITGNDGNNLLDGGDGNDTIKGGAGADGMTGGKGNDKFFVDNALDVVTEASVSGSGLDTVYSTLADYTLAANVENLVIRGSSNSNGTGNALANVMTGNSGANTLNGDLGNDTIDGKKGNDTMVGGDGNDKFYVDRIGDVVTEVANVYTPKLVNGLTVPDIYGDPILELVGTDHGHDSVIVSFEGYTLAANVEDLFLTGNAITGTGNGLNNLIRGTGANNILVGGAGNDELDGLLGDDTMSGGIGHDTYIVNTAGDIVNENASEGKDTVKSSVDFTLTNANVENLTLTGFQITSGTGNSGANVITGNLVGNVLRGLGGNDTLNGGNGDDNMDGGAGSDLYIVGQAGDIVNDTGAGVGEVDTVQSTVADQLIGLDRFYVLGSTIENLVLTGGAALNGTGNASNNAITGNDGSNILLGLAGVDAINGGKGNDKITGGAVGDNLTGGLGSDTFIFTAVADSATGVGNTDAILDFTSIDKIDLSLIDANSSVAGIQHLILDFNNVLTAGEIMMTRSGSTISVTIDTDNVAGANMAFSIVVDSSIPDTLLTEDNFLL